MKLINDVVKWSGRTGLPRGAAYTFVRCARKLEELQAQLETLTKLNDQIIKLEAQPAELEQAALRSAAAHPIVQKMQDSLGACNENNRQFAEELRKVEARLERVREVIDGIPPIQGDLQRRLLAALEEVKE